MLDSFSIGVRSALVAACCSTPSVGASGQVGDFAAFAMRHLPTAGAWEATYTTTDEHGGFGCSVVSYDWASEAWSLSTGESALGRTTAGRRYVFSSGRVGGGLTAESSPQDASLDASVNDGLLDEWLPSVVLRDLSRGASEIVEANPTESGGFHVVVRWIGANRTPLAPLATVGLGPEDVALWFDERGRMVRREQGADRWRLAWEFEYDDRCPDHFAVPARVLRIAAGGSSRVTRSLVSVRLVPSNEVGDRLSERGSLLSSLQAGRLAAESLGATATPTGAGRVVVPMPPGSTHVVPGDRESASEGSKPPSSFSSMRWPLILTGGIVVAMAMVIWWRRRA